MHQWPACRTGAEPPPGQFLALSRHRCAGCGPRAVTVVAMAAFNRAFTLTGVVRRCGPMQVVQTQQVATLLPWLQRAPQCLRLSRCCHEPPTL